MPGLAVPADTIRTFRALVYILLACAAVLAAPAQAQRLAHFLSAFPPAELFPGADRLGPPEGKPLAARAYAGSQPLGYVYLTTAVVNTRGYSRSSDARRVGQACDSTCRSRSCPFH